MRPEQEHGQGGQDTQAREPHPGHGRAEYDEEGAGVEQARQGRRAGQQVPAFEGQPPEGIQPPQEVPNATPSGGRRTGGIEYGGGLAPPLVEEAAEAGGQGRQVRQALPEQGQHPGR